MMKTASLQRTLERRHTAELDLIVLHCTELPTLQMAEEFGERIVLPKQEPDFRVIITSIETAGCIGMYTDDRMARHVIGFNPNSIGIELVNLGRYPQLVSFHSSDLHRTLCCGANRIRSKTPSIIKTAIPANPENCKTF